MPQLITFSNINGGRRPSIPSECCPVNLLIKVDFPTEGNPMNPTLATPVRATSKPAVSRQQLDDEIQLVGIQPPPPPLEVGVRSSRLSFASFAFNCPSPSQYLLETCWMNRMT